MKHPSPRTLRGLALTFFVIGLWLTILALVPRAVDQRVDQMEATAALAVEALEARQAADATKTPEPTLAPQQPQRRASGDVLRARITTYQAVPEQTDSTPCVGAMPGVNFCDPPFPIVANNCLSLGAKVLIGSDEYTVADRMASGTACDRFDVLTDGENYLIHETVTIL